MQIIKFLIQPLTAFGTPLVGDTLFGQLCWILRRQLGNERLSELLQTYTQNQPFMVVSDAFPKDHLPLPTVPSPTWSNPNNTDRKTLKKKKWLPLEALKEPMPNWQYLSHGNEVLPVQTKAQAHNTINRKSSTTGTGMFAPYTTEQTWYDQSVLLDLYIVFDPAVINALQIKDALNALGKVGFGRDASIGLGKFEIVDCTEDWSWPISKTSEKNCYLTLAACAPQEQNFCPVRSFYQVETRFGRHGEIAVGLGNPFKKPILLAKAGALLRPETINNQCYFVGKGLGGKLQAISSVMPETVQQAYAPVIAISQP